MIFLKIIVFALVATVLVVLLNVYGGQFAYAKSFANIVRMAAVIMMTLYVITQLDSVYELIKLLAAKLHMDDTYLNIVLKVVGIAYLAEFAMQLCEDAGEKAIGGKVQWVGKVMIIVIASPVILALVNMIADLI